jgi:hypothetical protein
MVADEDYKLGSAATIWVYTFGKSSRTQLHKQPSVVTNHPPRKENKGNAVMPWKI